MSVAFAAGRTMCSVLLSKLCMFVNVMPMKTVGAYFSSRLDNHVTSAAFEYFIFNSGEKTLKICKYISSLKINIQCLVSNNIYLWPNIN